MRACGSAAYDVATPLTPTPLTVAMEQHVLQRGNTSMIHRLHATLHCQCHLTHLHVVSPMSPHTLISLRCVRQRTRFGVASSPRLAWLTSPSSSGHASSIPALPRHTGLGNTLSCFFVLVQAIAVGPITHSASSVIFFLVILMTITEIFGRVNPKFSAAILDFGGHIGFSDVHQT